MVKKFKGIEEIRKDAADKASAMGYEVDMGGIFRYNQFGSSDVCDVSVPILSNDRRARLNSVFVVVSAYKEEYEQCKSIW